MRHRRGHAMLDVDFVAIRDGFIAQPYGLRAGRKRHHELDEMPRLAPARLRRWQREVERVVLGRDERDLGAIVWPMIRAAAEEADVELPAPGQALDVEVEEVT